MLLAEVQRTSLSPSEAEHPLVLFVILQRCFIQGLTIGATRH